MLVVDGTLLAGYGVCCRMSWTNFIWLLANAGKACLCAKYSTVLLPRASEHPGNRCDPARCQVASACARYWPGVTFSTRLNASMKVLVCA